MIGVKLSNREPVWLIAWLLGGLLVRATIAFFLPPGFDEAYYYLYSRHLDWSYFDHPPLVALTTGVGVWLTGTVSQFTIRLGTLVLYTIALWLLYLTSRRLFSVPAAKLTLAIATLIPIFLIGFGVLTLPDAPLIFFWTATLYVATQEFFAEKVEDKGTLPYPLSTIHHPLPPLSTPYTPTFRLALLGLLVGLACLSKYHGAALGVGLLGFCVTSPPHRRAFISPWILLSLGLFALAIAPVLVWNAQHDWISLRFQSGRAVPDRGYSLLNLLVTFLAGVAYLFPTFGFPLWWVSGKASIALFKGQRISTKAISPQFPVPNCPFRSSPTLLILWLSLPLMVGFTLMGGYRAILPTWAMPGFWGATLLLGARAAVWEERSPRGVRRWLRGSGLVIGAFLLIALLHIKLGTLQTSSRYSLFGGFLSPRVDSTVQLINIRDLRRQLAASPEFRKALDRADFLFTDNIYLAGQVGMAVAPLTAKPVTCLDSDLRGFAFWESAQQWVGKDGLWIAVEWQSPVDINRYKPYFQSIKKVAEFPMQRGGATTQTIRVYYARQLLQAYPRPYGN